jgi:GH15 family glucan-1,4-alpha-glucosidase
MIGDLQTAALVARDGSIDWLCLPRFDSAACFAALLDDDRAGHWRIAPTGAGASTSREYRGGSLVLETSWSVEDGEVRLIDFMPPRGEAPDLVRIVEGVRGRVELECVLRLRFDYGRIRPWTRSDPRGGSWSSGPAVSAIAGPDAIWLQAPVVLEDVGDEANDELRATFTVAAGERAAFVMTYQPSHLPAPRLADAARALADTMTFWDDWVGRGSYDGEWADEVARALVLLKGLTYLPTGGILAAATTSLPEEIGGVRNWDYRYCWLRDATFTLQALLGTGYVDEAKAWREWLVRAVAGDPAKLQIMYGLDGSQRLPESVLDWLGGFEGSAPVRVGNAAAAQLQLDVWGEVLDGLHLAREAGLETYDPAWELQRALLDWLEGHWDQPDNGLWEVRGPQQHFVHSKVMAWAGVDRAVHTVQAHGLEGPVDAWSRLRDEIHDDVCRHGYDADRGTFTQFYGSHGLDAALLLVPRVGFLPWDDPRIRGTVEAVQRELCVDGFMLRYDPDADGGADGLPGHEGVFLPCSFWLADALLASGRTEEATKLFEDLLALRNDVGMLSEEYDVAHRRQLGNTPQAFSLVGLVNTARHLSAGSTETSGPRGGSRSR